MKSMGIFACAAFALLLPTAARAQNGDFGGRGQVVVTVMPSKSKEQKPNVTQQDIKVLKVDGKEGQVSSLTPFDSNAPVEIVVLIDGGARTSLGSQISDIKSFIQEMPANTKMAVAYMEEGQAVFGTPLSSDPAQVLQGLHMPAGPPDINASPYFCLSDLAKHWPSQNRAARRIAVVISDGVDYYEMRFDPEDPYVHAAVDDSVRAGVVVYFLYWKNAGWVDRFGWAQDTGQNLMNIVTQATGGYSFWQGFGNPVALKPYFDQVRQRLQNQYELRFMAPLGDKSQFEHLQLKLQVPGTNVEAPQKVYIRPAAQSRQ